ncbi:uncharacterized protein TNCV_3268091 [Trichonephila clavipes]|nr:uncharacterized protein TNCV_3268091 [Trichonephila clavipes]
MPVDVVWFLGWAALTSSVGLYPVRPEGGFYEEKYKEIFKDSEPEPVQYDSLLHLSEKEFTEPTENFEPKEILSKDGKSLKEAYLGNSPNPCFDIDRLTQNRLLGLRLKLDGHLTRMNEDRCWKNIFLAKPMKNRPRRRPPLRWIDCIEKDLNILKVKNWKTVAKSRDARRKPGQGPPRAVEPLKKKL